MGTRSKDKRDIYYRYAKECGYRARSAFKLKQILQHFRLIDRLIEQRNQATDQSTDQSINVVDLCAAPGGWSEVCYEILHKRDQSINHESSDQSINQSTDESMDQSINQPINRFNDKVIAIDLAPISPLIGVSCILGDITRPQSLQQIRQVLNQSTNQSTNQSSTQPVYADLVLCDGAPDVTGAHDIDEFIQHALVLSALTIACCLLKPQPNQSTNPSTPQSINPSINQSTNAFVAKVFRGKNICKLLQVCEIFFCKVSLAKPRTCRNSSMEAFVVCEGYRPPINHQPNLEHPIDMSILEKFHTSINQSDADLTTNVEFVSCIDDADLDSDQSYPLSYDLTGAQYKNRKPAAQPIAPPWKKAAETVKDKSINQSINTFG